MATKCKRKVEIPGASSKLGKPKTTAAAAAELYPNHPRPTPEECRSVRDHLLSLHGFPQEFARYRKNKVIHDSPDPSKPFFGEDGSDETITRKESVLDGLVRTLLSQNTTDSNSTKAFASLKSSFPTWEDVLAAETKCIQDAIKCGGLAATKASCIKNILSSLLEKRGKICLEYLRGMPVDEIKAELCCFKGIGPKTQTFEYTPPEALLNASWFQGPTSVTLKYDMWSVGVVMLELILGSPHVFQISARTRALLDQHLEGWSESTKDLAYKLRSLMEMCILIPGSSPQHHSSGMKDQAKAWLASWKCSEEFFSQLVKNRDPLKIGFPNVWALRLVRQLLQWHPEDRLSVDEALRHPYFQLHPQA